MNYYPYILIPFTTWIIAQVLKFSISAIKGKMDLKLLYGTGGMPSAHSAVVSALAVTALALSGLNSAIFGVTVIYAAIVIYDSLGVRRASGEQAKAINQIFDYINRSEQESNQKIKEVLGHKLSEVIAGSLLGTIVAMMFNYNKLSGITNYIQTIPESLELKIYIIITIILLTFGIYLKIWVKKYKNITTIKSFIKKLFIALEIIGILNIGLIFAEYEKAVIISWRIWIILAFSILILWIIYIFSKRDKGLKTAINEAKELERKQYWLKKQKKSKKY